MRKLSVGFHPYEKRKNPKNNKTQIIMRVILDGKKREIRLPEIYDLSEKDLQKWNPIAQRIDEKHSDINDYLNGIAARRKLIDLDKLLKGENFTPTEVVNRLLGIEELKMEVTVMSYVKRHLREDIENSTKGGGTKDNYRNAINQFLIFLQLKGWDNLPIEKFKFAHANAFKKFLETPFELLPSLGICPEKCNQLYAANQLGSNPKRKSLKIENSVVSSSTKIKNIRPIFEKAINEDLIYKNPFKAIKLVFVGKEASELTPLMLRRVYEYIPTSSGLEYTKDLFLFMCFTGMAYIDTINLNPNELEFENGEIRLINKTRIKTGCDIRQVLCKEAASIYHKYYKSGLSGSRNRVFPNESSESLNRKLKIIQHIADIPFDLTTKNARITFKSILNEALKSNPEISVRMMGWVRPQSIKDLYNRFRKEHFQKAKEEIDEYLRQLLFKEIDFVLA